MADIMKSENGFESIISIIENAKHRAMKAVNTELINMYWEVGEYLSSLCAESSFGDKVMDEVASYIAENNPKIKGFNRRGLYRMLNITPQNFQRKSIVDKKKMPSRAKTMAGRIPLGYVLVPEQKLVLDPITAPLVQEIFQRYADGEIIRTIVEDFNRRGLKTKSGKQFSPNSFNRILKNHKYIGEYQYQDVIIPGGVPAIVTEDNVRSDGGNRS